MISGELKLNDRQKRLIYYFTSEEKATTTTTSHATINDISRQTATKDLKELETSHLIKAIRDGKFVRYYPGNHLKQIKK